MEYQWLPVAPQADSPTGESPDQSRAELVVDVQGPPRLCAKLLPWRNRKTVTQEPVRYTVLSRKAITLWAALIVAVGVGMAIWLLLVFGGGDANTQLDAIRTAGTIVVGTGGAAALLLAARRQRATEIALKHAEVGLRQKDRDQEHQQRVTAATEADAAA